MDTWAWTLPACLLLYRLTMDFVPLFPLNDVSRKTSLIRKRDLWFHYVPLGTAVILGLLDSPVTRVLQLVITILYTAGFVLFWWRPYLSGSSEAGKERWERSYSRTHRFLPRIGENIVPDTAHVAAALLVLIWLGIGVGQLFHLGDSSSLSSSEVEPASASKAGSTSIGRIQVAFTQQGDDPAARIMEHIGKTSQYLDIAVNALNHSDIVDAILAARTKGVQVRVITDRGEAKNPTAAVQLARLHEGGIPVKVNKGKGLMNLKLAIFDGSVAGVGSFNFTMNAATVNDEVLLFVEDGQTVSEMQAEFDRMWTDGNRFADLSGPAE